MQRDHICSSDSFALKPIRLLISQPHRLLLKLMHLIPFGFLHAAVGLVTRSLIERRHEIESSCPPPRGLGRGGACAMDWSAVYVNSGDEEGAWEDHGETRSSRNAHRLLHRRMSVSLVHEPPSTGGTSALLGPPSKESALSSAVGTDGQPQYSPLVAYAFTVNYILGVGSLGIPLAFYRAGLVMGNVLIVLVTFISYVTVLWVAETVARAREATAAAAASTWRSPLSLSERSALNGSGRRYSSVDLGGFDDFPEVTQLCEKFLGHFGAKMYHISLLGLMYGGLLGYSQVFVNSFLTQVTHIGEWQVTSAHAALVFACIVVPLSCSDLTEQIYVQLTMSVVRFAALAIMILSAAYAIYADPYDTGDVAVGGAADVSPPYLSQFSLVNLGGFGVMFSTGVFSQLFQHSVPGLLAPLGPKNQNKASLVFGSTLVTTMVFYIALGSVCSLYFGPKIASSVNLNWATFTWGLTSNPAAVPLWAKCLSMIVVIFPALDTLSVFPLISVTLGDNMAAIVPRRWMRAVGNRGCWKIVCRFIASVPPLLVSVFVSDLSLTLQLSGVAGVYVAFFAPALLQLRARKVFPASNVYSGRFSGIRYVYAVLGFGAFAFLVLLYQLAQQIVQR